MRSFKRCNTRAAHNALPALKPASSNHAHPSPPGALPPSAELGQRGEPSATSDVIVRNRLALIENNLKGEHAKDESVLMLSAMVGALLLSRSVKDPELSDRLLKTTRLLLVEQAQDA
ncbi:hypothetical protein ACNFCJ_09340 [Pseudomonas sp. NY15364]|uniref:hypothetical protein n=1 Tax=Pseudomonas sp. NY15364 TaxID=3400353 RepID=UPI003A8876AE